MTLTPTQTEELRALIERRREALVAEVGRDLHKLREDRVDNLVGPVPDRGDESVASLISELDQADATRDLGELRRLEAARRRMAEGSYGVCISCGLEIDYQRLRANPAAERCIQCQTLYEKTHAGANVSRL